jgi:hypothetical protein
MDLALQIPKVNPPHILSNFSSTMMALPCHRKPSRYMIPNHLEFLQPLKHHVWKFKFHLFQSIIFKASMRKHILKTMASLMEFGHENLIIKSM